MAMRQREGDQRLPVANKERSAHETVIERIGEDMPARGELGVKRYGSKLQPFNGRDFMQDAWEEYLDLGAYLEGIRREREAMINLLKEVAEMETASEVEDLSDQAANLLRSMGER